LGLALRELSMEDLFVVMRRRFVSLAQLVVHFLALREFERTMGTRLDSLQEDPIARFHE
jgi:hypothetical protein